MGYRFNACLLLHHSFLAFLSSLFPLDFHVFSLLSSILHLILLLFSIPPLSFLISPCFFFQCTKHRIMGAVIHIDCFILGRLHLIACCLVPQLFCFPCSVSLCVYHTLCCIVCVPHNSELPSLFSDELFLNCLWVAVWCFKIVRAFSPGRAIICCSLVISSLVRHRTRNAGRTNQMPRRIHGCNGNGIGLLPGPLDLVPL